MKVVLVFFAVLAVALSAETQYTNKFDNVNIAEILSNDRLLKGYVNCLLDKGKCTNDASELKKNLPDALATDCAKCTPKQKEHSETAIRYLVNNKKDTWAKLAAKYDPNDEYRHKYLDEAKAKGIDV